MPNVVVNKDNTSEGELDTSVVEVEESIPITTSNISYGLNKFPFTSKKFIATLDYSTFD